MPMLCKAWILSCESPGSYCSLNEWQLHALLTRNAERYLDTYRTAEVATKSPRFRRKSSTFVDAIHDLPATGELAPAQLYSTESGRLFHSGRIAIVTVGLPARGKT